MSKKIDISKITNKILKEAYSIKETARRISEAIEYDPNHPEKMHPDIEHKLSTDTHHLGGNKSFPRTGTEQHFAEKLASDRFKEVLIRSKSYLGDEQGNINIQSEIQKMLPLLMQTISLETPHRDDLVDLAIELVEKYFRVSGQEVVNWDVKLVSGNVEEGFDDEEDEDEDEMPELEAADDMDAVDEEVQKRRMLNAIMQGAAKVGHYMFQTDDAYDEVSSMNPRLISNYGKIMSSADMMYWLMPDMAGGAGGGGGGFKGGMENIYPPHHKKYPDEERWTIRVRALIFPVLVHELIKGFMELQAKFGEHENRAIAKHVKERADTFSAEIWDMRIGPKIWQIFTNALSGEDINAVEIKHHVYREIAKLPASEFHSFMKELLSGSRKGKQMLADLANKIKQDHEDRRNQEEIDDNAESILGGDDDYYDDDDDLATSDDFGPDDFDLTPFTDINKEEDITLDDLLDKIYDTGYESLTNKEKEILKRLSNN